MGADQTAPIGARWMISISRLLLLQLIEHDKITASNVAKNRLVICILS